MSTDDRDIESSNPSTNFTVGNFDQGSGFFTPVWESKRRIRSEPPGPPSSGGANRAAPSSKSPGRISEPPPSARTEDASTSSAKGSPVPRPRASGSHSQARSNPPTRAVTPTPPRPSEPPPAGAGSSTPALAAALSPAALSPAGLPPAVAAVFEPPHPSLDAGSPLAAPNLSDRPTEPPPAVKSVTPSAAARALEQAGPNLPPAAFLDEEPEFRSPRPGVPRPGRTERSPQQYRSLRATSAATRVHEQLRAKLQAEAAELDESRFDMAPETSPNPLNAEPSEPDPYPLSLLRRLRRTIRLAAPVPDAVRSLISKYDRG